MFRINKSKNTKQLGSNILVLQKSRKSWNLTLKKFGTYKDWKNAKRKISKKGGGSTSWKFSILCKFSLRIADIFKLAWNFLSEFWHSDQRSQSLKICTN